MSRLFQLAQTKYYNTIFCIYLVLVKKGFFMRDICVFYRLEKCYNSFMDRGLICIVMLFISENN